MGFWVGFFAGGRCSRQRQFPVLDPLLGRLLGFWKHLPFCRGPQGGQQRQPRRMKLQQLAAVRGWSHRLCRLLRTSARHQWQGGLSWRSGINLSEPGFSFAHQGRQRGDTVGSGLVRQHPLPHCFPAVVPGAPSSLTVLGRTAEERRPWDSPRETGTVIRSAVPSAAHGDKETGHPQAIGRCPSSGLCLSWPARRGSHVWRGAC